MKHSFIIAIDPGDVHVGYAILERDEHESRATMGVLHRPARDFVQLVETLAPLEENQFVSDIVVESFQHRPVGHQRFDTGETLQLIGALRFQTERQSIRYATVPPGNIEDLQRLFFARYLDKWVPSTRRPLEAKHAWSAWRVMMHFLMQVDPDYLMRLRKNAVFKTVEVVSRPRHEPRPADWFAGGMSWRLGE